ncbi:MAG: response regulator [Desulforhopalus sp.]
MSIKYQEDNISGMTINPSSSRKVDCIKKQYSLFLLLSLIFLPLFLSSSLYGKTKTTLKVGVYQNKPIIFINEAGVVQGLFIDILEDVALRENWKLEYVAGYFSDLHSSLKAGTIDLLPAIAYSKNREAFVDFTNETVIANWGEVYSSHQMSVTSLVDLEGQKIAVKHGDIHFEYLKRMTEQFNVSCRFIETDGYETIFEMLTANYVNIGIVNRLYGNEKKGEYLVQDSPIIFNPIEVRYAVPKKKNEEILNTLNVYLIAAKSNQNSVYYQAISRWLVVDMESKLPRWFTQSLYGMIAGILFLVSATLLFRSQVKKRTKELSAINQQLKSQIEERKKTEGVLRKFARIVEASCDAMALVDKEHRHVLANSVYRNMLTSAERDVESMSLQDLLGLEFFNKEFKQPVAACLKGDVVHFQTTPSPACNISSYWNITLSPYFSSTHEINGYVIDIRDVTEQIETQNRLENAQRMEAIGMLAGGVAHDLNNILSGLVSYPDMLLVNRPPDDPMTKPLQTIKKSGERAAAIVQDLLTLARKGVGSESALNLNDIVTEFVGSPEHDDIVMNKDGIKFQQKLDSDLLNIRGSSVHLQKILMNLFCNAVEAMPRGGKLTILTENRCLEKEHFGYEIIPGGEYAVIAVEDTGVGMSAAEIKRIFEPFYTNKILGRSGTGLGMAVVWGTLKDHNGFIDIDSEPGKGTLFTLYFPAVREVIPEKEEMELQNYLGRGERILVVDDMEEQRVLATQILELLGYAVDTASSGEEAVKKCRESEFHLIILDMIMPGGMDGLTTYKQINASREGQKIVIASGFSNSLRVRRAQESGAGMYLKKPYTIKALAEAVYHELAVEVAI